MVHYAPSGIFIGIMIGFILWCIALIILYAKAKNGKNNKGLRNLLAILVLAITVFASLRLGEYFGCSLKTGDYSNKECLYSSCDSPVIYKVTRSMGWTTYYCEAHTEEAQAEYSKWTGKNKTSSKSQKKDSYGHDQFDAIVIAERKVKEQLKAPSTAKFCKTTDYTVSVSGNTWTVKGYVDAQNSFGASLRNNFTITFTFTSSEKYVVDSCVIK